MPKIVNEMCVCVLPILASISYCTCRPSFRIDSLIIPRENLCNHDMIVQHLGTPILLCGHASLGAHWLPSPNCLLIICTRHLNIFAICFSYLYQIAHLGDDDEEPEFSSAMPLEEGDTFFFQPRPLKNLVLVDEQENLSPIMSCQVRLASCLCHFHYSKTLI